MTTELSKSHGFILIADEERAFIEAIKNELNGKNTPILPVTALTMTDAKEAVSRRTRFLAVLISAGFEKPNGIPLIRFIRINSPTLPIFISYNDKPPFDEEEKLALGIQDQIKKPIKFSQIMDAIKSFVILKKNSNDNSSVRDNIELEKEFADGDEHFTAIRVEDFLGGTTATFDFFVRLGPGKYIKILKKSETFDVKRLEGYIKKGVKAFYLEKTEHARYLGYCEKLADSLIKSSSYSDSIKAQGVRSFGEETLNLLKAHGLNSETLHYAGSFVKNVEQFVRSSKLDRDQRVAKLFDDITQYEHSVAVTIVAGVLGRHLKFQGERAVKLLGQASLLHDIGLLSLPEIFRNEDESKLSDAQLGEYYKHPKLGAEVLSELKVEPVVAQAVEQHHERRDRSGFPDKVGSGSINRLAEIVGISDEFVRILEARKNNPYLKVLGSMKDRVLPCFSYDIGEAFQTVFFPDS